MKLFFAAINVGFIFFMAYQLWKADNSSIRKFFCPALILKLTAGISLGLIYIYYYTVGDTFTYFNDGSTLADLARSDLQAYFRFLWAGDNSFSIWNDLIFLQPRALFMSKIVSVVNLISHNSYWITSLYFSFVSFAAAWMLVKAIVRLEPSLKYAAITGFLFFPSVVFWSSGLIKESLAMASLFFISALFLKVWLRERLSLWQWLLFPVAIWVLWQLKYYYLAVFLPIVSAGIIVNLVSVRFRHLPDIYRVLMWCIVFIVPLVLVSLIRPNFYPDRFLHVIVSNYNEFHAISDAEDLIYYQDLQPTVQSILRNAPWALFCGLFKPLPWEAGTMLQVWISVENIVLFILSISAVTRLPSVMQSPKRMLMFSMILYVVTLSVFLALSTPNFGTLSRYRVGFLPFFFLLITIENPLTTRVMRFIQRS